MLQRFPALNGSTKSIVLSLVIRCPFYTLNMAFLEEVLERVGVSAIIFLPIALYLCKWAFDLITDPLRDIPGPLLSRFTRLWLLRQYIKGDYQKTNVELHEQFGRYPKYLNSPYIMNCCRSSASRPHHPCRAKPI